MASTVASSVAWSTPATSIYGDRRSSKSSVTRAYSPDWKLYTGFAGLCVLSFAAALDAVVLVAGLPTIISKLNTTTISAIWIATAYHLASSILQPLFVSISFICGRKTLLAASVALAAAGSVICGVAPSATVLIIGRALQGAGGGAATAMAEVITSDLIPTEFKPRWLQILNVVWAVGTAAGPILGAGVAGSDLWKVVFYISIGLHVIGGALAMLLTIDIKTPRSMWKALGKFDWGGVFLFIVSFTTFLMTITLGGAVYPWSSWQLILLISLTIVTTLLFIILESFYIRIPFIDLFHLARLTPLTTFLTTFLHALIFYSLLTHLPIYYAAIKSLSPLTASLAILPNTALAIPGFLLVSLLISHTGKYKLILFAAWALTCIGSGLLALLDMGSGASIWVVVNILVGIGVGVIFSGLAFASQATAKEMKQDFAFGSSMLHFFRSCGAAAGTAATSTLFQHQFSSRLSLLPSLNPSTIAKYTTQAYALIVSPPSSLTTDEKDGIREAYAYALKNVWLALGVAGIVGAIACVFAKEYGAHVYSRVREEREVEERRKVETKGRERSVSQGTVQQEEV